METKELNVGGYKMMMVTDPDMAPGEIRIIDHNNRPKAFYNKKGQWAVWGEWPGTYSESGLPFDLWLDLVCESERKKLHAKIDFLGTYYEIRPFFNSKIQVEKRENSIIDHIRKQLDSFPYFLKK